MREADQQATLIRLCKARGWEAHKVESPGTAGWPDVEVLLTDLKGRGHTVRIEMKGTEGRPRKLQAYRLGRLHAAGHVAFWETDADLAFARIFTACKKAGIKL